MFQIRKKFASYNVSNIDWEHSTNVNCLQTDKCCLPVFTEQFYNLYGKILLLFWSTHKSTSNFSSNKLCTWHYAYKIEENLFF